MTFRRLYADTPSGDGDSVTKPLLDEVMQHYGIDFRSSSNTGMAACPLHEDRTPSMSYRLDEGLWRCHSCDEGGDSYTLIMLKENTDFRGARTIASSLNFSEGNVGGGGEHVSGSRYGGRRKVPARSGNQPRDGGYVPAWRRR